MKGLPRRDPINAHRRTARAQRRVGADARCACGETRPEAFVAPPALRQCAACARTAKGHTTIDQHHVAGRANHPLTVPVPVNDHRADLSSSQDDWPTSTRENPDGSPLLAAAAMIRGFADWLVYTLRRGVLWIAQMLEALEPHLSQVLGRRWWDGTEVARHAPPA